MVQERGPGGGYGRAKSNNVKSSETYAKKILPPSLFEEGRGSADLTLTRKYPYLFIGFTILRNFLEQKPKLTTFEVCISLTRNNPAIEIFQSQS